MVFKETMFLVLIAISLLLSTQVEGGEASLSIEEDLNLQRQLKLLNKPPIKSIQNEDGSIVDCIDINKQPAFDHPLLRNHIIQMRPTSFPNEIKNGTFPSSPSPLPSPSSSVIPSKIGLKSVGCPQGTVPIRRTRKKDLIIAKSLSSRYRFGPANVHPLASESSKYQFSTIKTRTSMKYYGAKVWINSRTPSYISNNFKEAAMWIENSLTDKLNSLQVGWTADNYQDTGCFNNLCPGYVQVSPDYHLDQIIPISTYGGNQHVLKALVFQDPETRNWWLAMDHEDEKNIPVGYWPKSIFTSLADFASELTLGGEVYNPPNVPPPHKTCFMCKIHIVDGSNRFIEPTDMEMHTIEGNPNCYPADYHGNQGEIIRYTCCSGDPGVRVVRVNVALSNFGK